MADLPVVRLRPKSKPQAIRHGFPWVYADELVLDRRARGGGGRYQIVYGRRRVMAMRDIGQPVTALLREMDDRELLQG